MNGAEEVVAGIQILVKYGADDVYAEHDVVYCGHSPADTMSPEDVKTLDDCGWFWNDDNDGWQKFV